MYWSRPIEDEDFEENPPRITEKDRLNCDHVLQCREEITCWRCGKEFSLGQLSIAVRDARDYRNVIKRIAINMRGDVDSWTVGQMEFLLQEIKRLVESV